MTPRRLAVLQDSPDFGGHERMFLEWLPGLLDSDTVGQVHVRCPAVNTRFLAALQSAAHPKLTVHPGAYAKGPGEPFAAPLRLAYGRDTAAFIRACGADLVLLLQGRIENLATPLLWLPRSLELVNYLPMAHSDVEMGKPAPVAAVTDRVKRLYYRRPNRTIVVSRAVAAQVRRAGASGPIQVVENVPPLAGGDSDGLDRAEARRALRLPDSDRIALFMGRFDARQKGLDRLLRDVGAAAQRLSGWRFLFVGQGPAEAELRAVLDASVAGEVVGWTDRPGRYLAASDVLLLPSRFEGVPLVMLEALQQGLPVLASEIDVFREYLPAANLRDFERPVDLASALRSVTEPAARAAFAAHACAVTRRLDPAASRTRFAAAVLGQAEADGQAAGSPERLAS